MAEGGEREGGIREAIRNFFWFLRRTKLSEKKQRQEGGQAEAAPEKPAEAEGAAEKPETAAEPVHGERKPAAAAKPEAAGGRGMRGKRAAAKGGTENKKIEKELKAWRKKVELLTKKVEELENQLKANAISPNQAVNRIQVVYGEVDREENSINREMRATKAVMKGTVFDYYKRRMTLDEFRKRMLEYRGRLRVLQVEKAELKKEGSRIKEIGGNVRQVALQMPDNAVIVPGGGEGLEAVFGGGGAAGRRGKTRVVIGGIAGGGDASGGEGIVVESGGASGGGAVAESGAASGKGGNAAEGGTPPGGGRGGIGAVIGGIASGAAGIGSAAASALKGGGENAGGSHAASAGAERAEKEARAAGESAAAKDKQEIKGARAWAESFSGQGGTGSGRAKPALPKLPKEGKGADAQGAAGGETARGKGFDRDALEEKWGKSAGVQKILGAKGAGGTDSERLAELEKKINELLKAHKISESDLDEKARDLDTSRIIENFNKLIDLVELEKRAKKVGVPQTAVSASEVSAVGMGSPKKIEAIKGIAIELKKHRIVTDFDRVLSLVKEKNKIGMLEIAATLGIDKKWAEECCEILEQSGLVEVRFPPFGKVEVRLAGYVEEKKPKKK